MEILVRVKDRVDPDGDRIKTSRLFQRGDVITVQPDGHPWSPRELTNPHWRILVVLDMTVKDKQSLVGHSIREDPDAPIFRRRGTKIDLDHVILLGPVRDALDDDTRTLRKIPVVLVNVRTVIKAKPAEIPPAVIG